jgi:hypothetical protein
MKIGHLKEKEVGSKLLINKGLKKNFLFSRMNRIPAEMEIMR